MALKWKWEIFRSKQNTQGGNVVELLNFVAEKWKNLIELLLVVAQRNNRWLSSSWCTYNLKAHSESVFAMPFPPSQMHSLAELINTFEHFSHSVLLLNCENSVVSNKCFHCPPHQPSPVSRLSHSLYVGSMDIMMKNDQQQH